MVRTRSGRDAQAEGERNQRTNGAPGRARQHGVLAVLILLVAACGAETTSSLTPSVSQDTLASSGSVPLATLPPELVGTWLTSTWLDQSGSQQIVRTYVFSSDGRYEYTIGMCQSSTDCSLEGQESGYAEAANGTLSLEPQTEPNDGSRSWPYVVGQDPDVGDIQLHITLPDGQVDIFYLSQP